MFGLGFGVGVGVGCGRWFWAGSWFRRTHSGLAFVLWSVSLFYLTEGGIGWRDGHYEFTRLHCFGRWGPRVAASLGAAWERIGWTEGKRRTRRISNFSLWVMSGWAGMEDTQSGVGGVYGFFLFFLFIGG